MNDLCTRCGRRERYGRLLVCRDCCNRLVGRTQPERELPEWRRRSLIKDFSGWGRAA